MVPVLYSIPAFDPAVDSQAVRFYWESQSWESAVLNIYRTTDTGELSLIYTQEGPHTPNNTITIPAGEKTLASIPYLTQSEQNVYVAKLQIKYRDTDSSGSDIIVTSGESDGQALYSYQTPTFRLDSVYNGKILRSSQYNVTAVYNQSANEPLNYFEIYLQDKSETTITTSGKIYDPSVTGYLFNGLVDGETYYFYAHGETKYGTELNTEKVKVRVKFETPRAGLSVTAESEPCEGVIRVSFHINSNLYKLEHPDVGKQFSDNTWALLHDNTLEYTNSTGIMESNSVGMRLRNPQDGMLVYHVCDTNHADIGELYYFVVPQTVYNTLEGYHTTTVDETNPFDDTIKNSDVLKSTDIYKAGDDIQSVLTYWKSNSEKNFPVPTNDTTVTYYAYFYYRCGVTHLFSKPVQIDPAVDNIWDIVIRTTDGNVTLSVSKEVA